MRIYGEHWLRPSIVRKLRMSVPYGEFHGILTTADALYLEAQTAFHAASGTVLIFTRDSGHHTSGWFKNPDYERCLHLSLSFREPFNQRRPRPHDIKLADEWVQMFFEDARRLTWEESAKSKEGIVLEVQHWSVFCDINWQPFHPRGEVYSTELTEAGWKSFSELHPEDPRKEPSSLYAG